MEFSGRPMIRTCLRVQGHGAILDARVRGTRSEKAPGYLDPSDRLQAIKVLSHFMHQRAPFL